MVAEVAFHKGFLEKRIVAGRWIEVDGAVVERGGAVEVLGVVGTVGHASICVGKDVVGYSGVDGALEIDGGVGIFLLCHACVSQVVPGYGAVGRVARGGVSQEVGGRFIEVGGAEISLAEYESRFGGGTRVGRVESLRLREIVYGARGRSGGEGARAEGV